MVGLTELEMLIGTGGSGRGTGQIGSPVREKRRIHTGMTSSWTFVLPVLAEDGDGGKVEGTVLNG